MAHKQKSLCHPSRSILQKICLFQRLFFLSKGAITSTSSMQRCSWVDSNQSYTQRDEGNANPPPGRQVFTQPNRPQQRSHHYTSTNDRRNTFGCRYAEAANNERQYLRRPNCGSGCDCPANAELGNLKWGNGPCSFNYQQSRAQSSSNHLQQNATEYGIHRS